MKSLRIVFMGTPEFAVASLKALHESSHHIVGVVTVADKPAGRGQKLQSSPVKQFAVEHHLPVLQPEKLKAPEFVEALRSLNADLFVVVAFRMLPEVVWNMPPLGTINLHGSLLPRYRGAAPIHWAVINGEKETGVTTFFLQHEIDTGAVIRREKLSIGPNETTGQVHDRMMIMGAQALVTTVDLIAKGEAVPLPQDNLIAGGEELKHAPKIFKPDCEIQWNQPGHVIHNFVRGLNPVPTAWTTFQGKNLRVFAGYFEEENTPEIGSFNSDGKKFLRVGCAGGWYYLTEVQLEGKKRMKVDEMLRGMNLAN